MSGDTETPKVLTLRLNEKQYRQLLAVAQVTKSPVAKVVRDAIDAYLLSIRHSFEPLGVQGMRCCKVCCAIEPDGFCFGKLDAGDSAKRYLPGKDERRRRSL